MLIIKFLDKLLSLIILLLYSLREWIHYTCQASRSLIIITSILFACNVELLEKIIYKSLDLI